MARRNSNDFIDVIALLKQYISKWYLFVISVLLCGGLAFFVTKVKKPEYSVNANLLIKTEDSGPSVDDMVGGALGSLFGSDSNVEDEIFMVSSHSLYRDVARSLGINQKHIIHKGFMDNEFVFKDYPVEVQAPEALLDTLSHSLLFKVDINREGLADIKVKVRKKTVSKEEDVRLPYTVKTPLGSFVVATTKNYVAGEPLSTRITLTGYDAAAEQLDEDVHSEIASKRSNVISLSIETTSPEFGKAVLNEILALYNKKGIVEKRNSTERSANFIEDRLAILTDELAQTEDELNSYREQYGIMDPYSELKYQTEKKAEVEKRFIESRTQLEVLQLINEFISNPDNAYDLVPLMIDSQNIATMFNSYNEVILERKRILESARPDNATVRQIEDRINAMRKNIAQSIARMLNSQKVVVKDLQRELDSTEGIISTTPEKERQFKGIARQNSVKGQLYMFLLQKREENQLMLANAQPKGQIIDEAYTMSEPLGMSKKMILLLGVFFGLILPPIYLYIRRIIHNRFETRQEVERVTEVPILGEMCTDHSGRSIVVSANDTSSASELFRLMRVNLLFVLNDVNDKVVLVTSTSSGEGKSFISINLAGSLVLMGKKVIVVGMDIRKPRLAEYLGMSPRFGLTQYLSSADINLSQIINPAPSIPGLDVICAGPVPPNPGELLISKKVDRMFEELREKYDYIIVDTAPIGIVSDTFPLDRVADASIYVCRANYTSLKDLDLVNDIFENNRLKKLSLVVNGTHAKKSYGYGNKKSSKD